ncbi:MAG: hypothetical protein P8N02_03115 [Actinomycetota bacterium]|nr:hypothetical protein [Actinomycetota bacterium]
MTRISPTPTDEEAAAIVAAIELMWPQPVAAGTPPVRSEWRFSGRHWVESNGWPRRNY